MIIGHWLSKVVEALRAVAYEMIVASNDRIQTKWVIGVVVPLLFRSVIFGRWGDYYLTAGQGEGGIGISLGGLGCTW